MNRSLEYIDINSNNTRFYGNYWDVGNTKNILLNDNIRQWMTCADQLHKNSSFIIRCNP